MEREKCREIFEKYLKKIFFVKNISSPTAKILFFAKVLSEVMPSDG